MKWVLVRQFRQLRSWRISPSKKVSGVRTWSLYPQLFWWTGKSSLRDGVQRSRLWRILGHLNKENKNVKDGQSSTPSMCVSPVTRSQSQIIQFSSAKNGITWFWIKLKTSRISSRKGGRFCSISRPKTDSYSQVLLYRMTWQNYGRYSISSCQRYSTHSMTSMNGSTFLSSRLWRRTSLSASKFSRNCTLSYVHSFCVDSKRMSKPNYPQSHRKSFVVLWAVAKNIFMTKWYGTRTSAPRTSSQLEVWWTCWWGWKRYVIIRICSSLVLSKVLSIGSH